MVHVIFSERAFVSRRPGGLAGLNGARAMTGARLEYDHAVEKRRGRMMGAMTPSEGEHYLMIDNFDLIAMVVQ